MHDLTGQAYVFAYGSLVADLTGGAFPATLVGHRRRWGVAMDNRVAVPGYKRYRDPLTGHAPEVFVAYLDVVPTALAAPAVSGLCIPVGRAELDGLDRRERNYDRVDVTPLVTPRPPGRVWTYRGSAAGRARAQEGRASGTLVVVQAYVRAVEAAFSALGSAAQATFRASTEPWTGPVMDLVREDLPG